MVSGELDPPADLEVVSWREFLEGTVQARIDDQRAVLLGVPEDSAACDDLRARMVKMGVLPKAKKGESKAALQERAVLASAGEIAAIVREAVQLCLAAASPDSPPSKEHADQFVRVAEYESEQSGRPNELVDKALTLCGLSLPGTRSAAPPPAEGAAAAGEEGASLRAVGGPDAGPT